MNQRYFRIEPSAYEAARLALDEAMNMSPGETVYNPADIATLDAEGWVLIGAWSMHCGNPLVAAAIADVIARGVGHEMTASQYWAAIPPTEVHPHA